MAGAPGELPDLLYVPCQAVGPLVHQVDRLRGIFAENHIGYAVLDFVALACDGPPEDAWVALGFFQALARLEVGACLLAHINRDKDTTKPFWSAFWHNSARATWYLQPDHNAGESSLTLALRNRKVNEGAPSQPLGLRFEFGAERTTITRTPLGAASELSGELPLRSRMAAALRSGPLTYGALADQLAVSYDMVKKVANEGRDRTFTILEPEAGTRAKRVALLSDRTPYSLSSEIAAAPIAVSLVVVRKPYFSTSTFASG